LVRPAVLTGHARRSASAGISRTDRHAG
jgi:hypothetical protein